MVLTQNVAKNDQFRLRPSLAIHPDPSISKSIQTKLVFITHASLFGIDLVISLDLMNPIMPGLSKLLLLSHLSVSG